MGDLALELGSVKAFRELPRAELDALVKSAHYLKFEPDEFVCHQGDFWHRALYLAAGELRWAMLSPSGKEYVLYTIEPGRVFWGHSLFDDQPMPAALQAKQPSEGYLWDRDTLFPIMDRNPAVWHEITREFIATMRRAREIIYGLAFQPVAGRLAKLLLTQFPAQEKQPQERSLTLTEIAARVASSPEGISRMLRRFEEEGILEITRASITLNDRSKLERLVGMADMMNRKGE